MNEVNYLKTFRQRKGANVGSASSCKYIAGEKPYGDNPWCGKHTVPGSSYCRDHHFICHQIMDDRLTTSFVKMAQYIARTSR